MKKMIALLVALMMALSMIPTFAEDAVEENPWLTVVPGDTKLHLGFVVMDISNPYFIESVEGAEKFAEMAGYELTVIDGGSNAEKQVTGLENLITIGCDACDMRAVDSAAMVDIVKAAAESGMSLCTYPEYPEMTATMTYDDYAQGSRLAEAAADWINEKLGGEAEVAFLTQPSSETIRLRVQAFYDVLSEKCPNAEIVAEVEGYTPEDGMNATESILQAHPNLKVILCINDSGALGAYEAVVGAGKATDDFFIGGIDGDISALEKIAEGSIYRASVASSMLTPEVAFYIIQNMARAKLGLDYEYKMVFEVIAITAENVEEYMARTPDYEALYNMPF